MTIGPPPLAASSLWLQQDMTESAENQYLILGKFFWVQLNTPFLFITSRAITIF
jgi:hypothetical protein